MTIRVGRLSIVFLVTFAALGIGAAPAAELKKVTVVMDWIPYQPQHFAYWLAKSRGWYANQGLDVSIEGSRGSNLVAQLVVAGRAEFGNMAASALVQSMAKQDTPLKMVAVELQKDTTAAAWFDSSGIKSVKDFEGRSMGIVPGSLQYLLWPSFARSAGIDPAKVRLINSDFQLIQNQFEAKRFDILGNFLVGAEDEARFTEHGETLGTVVLSDYLPLIGHGIVTSDALIAKDPKLVEGFVAATQKAWKLLAAEPQEATEEAARVIAANVENAPPAELMAKYARKAIPARFFAPSTRDKPMGWSSPAEWEKMIEVLAETGNYAKKPTVDQLMTDRFVER